MKKSKLDHPHIKLYIANGIASGKSQRQLAEELKTSQPAIARLMKHADSQAMLEDESKKFLEQVRYQLRIIENDPQFKIKLQKKLERMILTFRY